jgi:hypothetical protein
MGGVAVVLERWNPYARIRQDVWGADFLVRHGRALIAVQATSGSNHSKRVEKSIANPDTRHWLETGVLYNIYSDAKRGPRGKRKVWTPRITQLVLNGDTVTVL